MECLVDLIKVYDNDLDDYMCDQLIDHFEKSHHNHKKVSRNRTPNFTEYNLTRDASKNNRTQKIYTDLIHKIHIHGQEYFDFVDQNFNYLFPTEVVYSKTVFPKSYGIERLRIKRYNTEANEAFNTHVDSMNLLSCPRFLSFLWYLNDVDEGGQTIFHGKEIKPKKGRLVIFPPLWLFPHMGTEPISNTKYIMSSYLRYNRFTNSMWERII